MSSTISETSLPVAMRMTPSAWRVRHDIGAPSHTTAKPRHIVVSNAGRGWRQHDYRRLVQLHDMTIGLDDLIGITRAEDDQAGNGAQRDQLLHWLMGRSISPSPMASWVKTVGSSTTGEPDRRGA